MSYKLYHKGILSTREVLRNQTRLVVCFDAGRNIYLRPVKQTIVNEKEIIEPNLNGVQLEKVHIKIRRAFQFHHNYDQYFSLSSYYLFELQRGYCKE